MNFVVFSFYVQVKLFKFSKVCIARSNILVPINKFVNLHKKFILFSLQGFSNTPRKPGSIIRPYCLGYFFHRISLQKYYRHPLSSPRKTLLLPARETIHGNHFAPFYAKAPINPSWIFSPGLVSRSIIFSANILWICIFNFD